MSDALVVVGGSLAGLTLALACASRGVPVRVIERAAGRLQGGDSLSIDLQTLAETIGHDPSELARLPTVHAYRQRLLTSWWALYTWLRERALAAPGLVLEEGLGVSSVQDLGDRVQLSLSDGSLREASAVVGADGYRSAVRRALMPEQPFARYAGYLVWRGLVDEQRLGRPVDWPSQAGLWIDFAEGYRLVAGVLPGADGSVVPGRRQVAIAWFDAHRQALLEAAGCLSADAEVIGTLPRGAVDAATRRDLAAQAPRLWPSVWAQAVLEVLRTGDTLSGAPIAEYAPTRLAMGRIALVGDAAHSVSPMTGSGYATAVADAAVLAHELATGGPHASFSAALARYEAQRLPAVRALVAHSQRLSAAYCLQARVGPRV